MEGTLGHLCRFIKGARVTIETSVAGSRVSCRFEIGWVVIETIFSRVDCRLELVAFGVPGMQEVGHGLVGETSRVLSAMFFVLGMVKRRVVWIVHLVGDAPGTWKSGVHNYLFYQTKAITYHSSKSSKRNNKFFFRPSSSSIRSSMFFTFFSPSSFFSPYSFFGTYSSSSYLRGDSFLSSSLGELTISDSSGGIRSLLMSSYPSSGSGFLGDYSFFTYSSSASSKL